jgi:hypothetical protein
VSYNLIRVSGVKALITKLGWHSGGGVHDCTVIFALGYDHVAIGVGDGVLDAHNNARKGSSSSSWASITDSVYNP